MISENPRPIFRRALRVLALALPLMLAGVAATGDAGPDEAASRSGADARGTETFEIAWDAIAAGGGTSTGGEFALTDTVGQAVAGPIAGGDFEGLTGFWAFAFGELQNVFGASGIRLF